MERLEITDINDVPLTKALLINYIKFKYEGGADLNDDSVLKELRFLYENNDFRELINYEYTFSDIRLEREMTPYTNKR